MSHEALHQHRAAGDRRRATSGTFSSELRASNNQDRPLEINDVLLASISSVESSPKKDLS